MRSQRRRAGWIDQAADTYVTQGVGPIGGTSFEGGVDPVQQPSGLPGRRCRLATNDPPPAQYLISLRFG